MTTPYHYTWSPAAPDTNYIENLSAGTYEITVTDDNGCPFKTSYNVVQPNKIEITFGPVGPLTICDGTTESVEITVTGGSETYTSYEWIMVYQEQQLTLALV